MVISGNCCCCCSCNSCFFNSFTLAAKPPPKVVVVLVILLLLLLSIGVSIRSGGDGGIGVSLSLLFFALYNVELCALQSPTSVWLARPMTWLLASRYIGCAFSCNQLIVNS